MIEYVGGDLAISSKPILQLPCLNSVEVLNRLLAEEVTNFSGIAISRFNDDINGDLAAAMLKFCAGMHPGGATLSLTHTDIGSGTDCEQRLFDLIAERRVRESEKVFAEKVKRDSSKEKDFSAAASKKRKGQAGIDAAVERLTAIDAELADLERQKLQTSWYCLFNQIQTANLNSIRQLELSNCGLHATGLNLLTHVMLELEHRAEGGSITWLTLDGNDLTDISMGVLASFLRLSKEIQVLLLRNVGITEQGVSELVAGLVTNRSLRLLDVRANGLCATETAKAAISGVQRFNTAVHILLT